MKIAALAAALIAFALLAADSPSPVVFTDVTASAGIHFVHSAGRAGKKYLPETLGAGCAFFDADGDGWVDLLFVNSHGLPALYRNNRNGTFTDITRGSGLDVSIYGRQDLVARLLPVTRRIRSGRE